MNLRNADGTWTVIGIVSYGHGQCTIGWHDVYAKVSFYLNWIYSYVKTSPQRPPANQRFRNNMPALMSSESIKPRNSIQLPVNYSDGENVSLSLSNSTADAAVIQHFVFLYKSKFKLLAVNLNILILT